jgi:hypothetical protein
MLNQSLIKNRLSNLQKPVLEDKSRKSIVRPSNVYAKSAVANPKKALEKP